MNIFLLFGVILAAQVDRVRGVRKCSPDVVTKIHLLWEKEGIPQDLIKDAVKANKQNIIKTTDGYYPIGTSCGYTEFTEDGKSVTLTRVEMGKKYEEHRNVYEANGVVIETDTGVKRYHVYNKDGVAAWYKCADTADAEDGDAEAAIKVPKAITYDVEDVKTAENKLKATGITLTTDYNWFC